MRIVVILLFLGVINNSCSEKETTELETLEHPRIVSFKLSTKDNPLQLMENVYGKIIGDSVIQLWSNHIVKEKMMRPRIEASGGGIYVNNNVFQNGYTEIDFSLPVTISVRGANETKEYKTYFHCYTGLPVVYIETKNREPIISRDEYVTATFEMYEDVITRSGSKKAVRVNIKGRGNSTWTHQSKKPYILKFDEKISLLGEHEDKSWVLLANAFDKTMLRNEIAFFLSSESKLGYTPKSHFVELFLNGEYSGTYQLVEKIKIAKHRVNVGDNGFILEIDGKAEQDDVTFRTNNLKYPVNIKEPKVEYGSEDFEYVKNYVNIADSVLYSSGFINEEGGWKKYFEMSSFVDWYIINEICKAPDAVLHTSCYMSLPRGGKICMGPVWDYDTGFGNYQDMDCSPYGFYVKQSTWFSRMFEDPSFKESVKERVGYFYSSRDSLYLFIDETAKYLSLSVSENNKRWSTLYNYGLWNNDNWGSYFNEVQSLKEWIDIRIKWLKTEIEKL